jgi:CheY-like chemotaxis protein
MFYCYRTGGMMLKILVVDDSLFQRKSICQILADAGYEVAEATDGLDGLEKALAVRPDCILTDLLMPRMDGIEFITELKARGPMPPLFVLTADIQESRRRLCMDLGVNGFLSKPPKKCELLGAIDRHFKPESGP